MMRKLVAAGLAFGIQVTIVSAPLVHLHPDDHDTDHHRGHAVHAHVAGHAPAAGRHAHGPIAEDDDHERAVYLQVFVSEALSAFNIRPAPVPSFDLIPPRESRAHRSVDVTHGHDPPFTRSTPSRAPPRRPVLI